MEFWSSYSTYTHTHAREQLAFPDGATHVAMLIAGISFIDLLVCPVSLED